MSGGEGMTQDQIDKVGFWTTMAMIVLTIVATTIILMSEGTRFKSELQLTRDSLNECRENLCRKEEDGMVMFVVPCSRKCKEGGFK